MGGGWTGSCASNPALSRLATFQLPQRWETHVDVSLAVAQEEVVHDGAVMQVLQRRHVLHSCHAALVHLVDLLPGEGALFVGVHLHDNNNKTQPHCLNLS